jgi:hypothetical protein
MSRAGSAGLPQIRGGQGLGDSLYVQSVARYYLMKGKPLAVRSSHADVFRPLGLPVIPFSRDGAAIVAHYVQRKGEPGTDQWQDVCVSAGIPRDTEMQLDWKLLNPANADWFLGVRRPVIAVLLPRHGMNRSDGFANELLPNWKIIDQLLQCNAYKVQIGQGDALYRFHGIDLNLANKTTIGDLLDIASMVDGFVGWCSFMLPLAESLQKPFFSMWSARGMKSRNAFISTLTPKKVIHRKDLAYNAIDDEPIDRIQKRFDDFLREVTRRAQFEGQAHRPGRLGAGGVG